MSQRDGLGSANQAHRDRTGGIKGTAGVPAVRQRGGTQGRSSGGSLCEAARSGVRVCCATPTWFHGWAGGAGEALLPSRLHAAALWRRKRGMRVVRLFSSHCSPSPLQTQRWRNCSLFENLGTAGCWTSGRTETNPTNRIYHPALLRGGESSPTRLWVTRLRGDFSLTT